MGDPEELFRGRVFRVSRERVGAHTYDVVRHPGAVAILPLLAEPPRVVLLRQQRHAVGGWIWEIPAGTLDVAGEDPADCARRELVEETGYRTDVLELVASFYSAPGFCDERIWLFVARELAPGESSAEPDERIEVHCFTREESLAMAERGEIEDAKTLVALHWWWREHGPRA